MAENELTFFDLPSGSEPSNCWSPNTWRTRLLLNFKGIPYHTTWTQYPDIKPTLQSRVSPNDADSSAPPYKEYTLPAIKLPDGRYLMESESIALELAKLYPDPPLPVDKDVLQRARESVSGFLKATVDVFIPLTVANLMPPASASYYTARCPEYFGKSLEQMDSEDKNLETVWEDALPWLRKLAGLLTEKGREGPFVEGEKVSYADLVIVALLAYVKAMDEMMLLKIVMEVRELGELFAACEGWMKRDDS